MILFYVISDDVSRTSTCMWWCINVLLRCNL